MSPSEKEPAKSGGTPRAAASMPSVAAGVARRYSRPRRFRPPLERWSIRSCRRRADGDRSGSWVPRDSVRRGRRWSRSVSFEHSDGRGGFQLGRPGNWWLAWLGPGTTQTPRVRLVTERATVRGRSTFGVFLVLFVGLAARSDRGVREPLSRASAFVRPERGRARVSRRLAQRAGRAVEL